MHAVRSVRSAGTVSVLVVDDDEDNALVLEAALQFAGFEVTVARSLREARAVLSERAVDALVTDYSLGDGDAVELVSSLGSRRPRVAILVTGYGAPEDRERSLAAGFDAHLLKPVGLHELERTVRDKLAQATGSGAT
jgi:CheY-like chemotaxis protein